MSFWESGRAPWAVWQRGAPAPPAPPLAPDPINLGPSQLPGWVPSTGAADRQEK